MKLKRITPLLVVDAIEPLLPLWRDALGFAVLAQVDEGPVLGFVLLARDDQHLMLQTRDSLANDVPAVAAHNPGTILYTDVDDLDAAHETMQRATVLVGPRTTFYGAREIFYATPSGPVVALAEHTAAD